MPFDESMRCDWPGISAFLRVGDEVYHTYSTFGRGTEEFHNRYRYLDLPRSAAKRRGKTRSDAPSRSACRSGETCASPTNTTPDGLA
jgi:hypothetical protein